MIFEAPLSKRLLGIKQWPAEKLGGTVFDADRVRQLLDRNSYNANDSDGIRWLEDELLKTTFHMDAANAHSGLSCVITSHPTLRLSDLSPADYRAWSSSIAVPVRSEKLSFGIPEPRASYRKSEMRAQSCRSSNLE